MKADYYEATIWGDIHEKFSRPKGDNHWDSTLREEDLPEIRERIRFGESYYAIAEDFDVTGAAIRSIAAGESWVGVGI